MKPGAAGDGFNRAVRQKTSDEPGRLRKRSVLIAGHRTSVSLENAFWRSLRSIARDRDMSMAALITGIDRTRSGNLSSAIRVFVLAELSAGGSDPTAKVF